MSENILKCNMEREEKHTNEHARELETRRDEDNGYNNNLYGSESRLDVFGQRRESNNSVRLHVGQHRLSYDAK